MPRKSNRRNKKQKAGSRASDYVNGLTENNCSQPLNYSNSVQTESSGNMLTNFVKNNLGSFHKLIGGGKKCGCNCKKCTCNSKSNSKCGCKCKKCTCNSNSNCGCNSKKCTCNSKSNSKCGCKCKKCNKCKNKSLSKSRKSKRKTIKNKRGGGPASYVTGEDRMNVGDSIPTGSTVPENFLQKAQKWWNGEYSIFTENKSNISYNPDMQLKCGGTDCTTPAKLDGNLTNPPLDLDHIPNPTSDPIVDDKSLVQGVSTFGGYELDNNGVNYVDPRANPSHPDAYKAPNYDIPNSHAGGNRRRSKYKRSRKQKAGGSTDWRTTNYSAGPANAPNMSEAQFKAFNKSSEMPKPSPSADFNANDFNYEGELWRNDNNSGVSGYDTLRTNMFGSGKRRNKHKRKQKTKKNRNRNRK